MNEVGRYKPSFCTRNSGSIHLIHLWQLGRCKSYSAQIIESIIWSPNFGKKYINRGDWFATRTSLPPFITCWHKKRQLGKKTTVSELSRKNTSLRFHERKATSLSHLPKKTKHKRWTQEIICCGF